MSLEYLGVPKYFRNINIINGHIQTVRVDGQFFCPAYSSRRPIACINCYAQGKQTNQTRGFRTISLLRRYDWISATLQTLENPASLQQFPRESRFFTVGKHCHERTKTPRRVFFRREKVPEGLWRSRVTICIQIKDNSLESKLAIT